MDGRTVTLAVCRGGTMLGVLPSFPVPEPWWRQVEDVVDGARVRFGCDVTVLRLLAGPSWGVPGGGAVTYLAEVDDRPPVPLAPWTGPDPLTEQPLRLPFARPGGPAADLGWARGALAAQGISLTGPPRQVRTWNLSSIWRLPTAAGDVWLKVVPPFFDHEPRVLIALAGAAVPDLLAAGDGRSLLADVPGTDQYDARESLPEMVRLLVDLQTRWIGRTDQLLELGVPDLRAAALLPRIRRVLDQRRGELSPGERAFLDALVAGLPARFAEIATCGLPDTLVHGDFHPGNVRGTPGRFAILDWGDSGVGNPMLDQLAFGAPLNPPDRVACEQLWARLWGAAVPGCDADRAADLLRPVGALHGAVTYQRFLEHIEPDEHPYHAGDPVAMLRLAAATARNRGAG
ncbi:MAG TPA: phosphotransferase [Nakamurella sp.]